MSLHNQTEKDRNLKIIGRLLIATLICVAAIIVLNVLRLAGLIG